MTQCQSRCRPRIQGTAGKPQPITSRLDGRMGGRRVRRGVTTGVSQRSVVEAAMANQPVDGLTARLTKDDEDERPCPVLVSHGQRCGLLSSIYEVREQASGFAQPQHICV